MKRAVRAKRAKNGLEWVKRRRLPSVSILIADSDKASRAAAVRAIQSLRGMRVVGEAGTGLEAVSMTGRLKPRVVLLDEPFSAMDRDLRRELAIDVKRFADDLNVPILLVTHHRNEARAMGDRGILISRGAIEKRGRIDEVLPPERDRGDEP